MIRKSKIAPRGGLQSTRGAIMLSAPNNFRTQATGNCLRIHATIHEWHVGVAASGTGKISGEGLATAGGMAQPSAHNVPGRPVLVRWNSLSGIGDSPHGPVDPRREARAHTVGPRSRPQRAIGGWRPAARRRDTRPERPRGPPVERGCHIPP